MSKRYTGNFISGTPQVPTLSSNNGIFDTNDVYTAVNNGAWQEPDGIYEIPRSLRFRQSASAYLSRTPSTAGNRSTWTYSGWIKRGLVTTRATLIGGYTGTANGALRTHVIILDDNTLQINSDQMQTATDFNIVTNQVFRDPAAWYHIVVAFDTTQAISQNRIKLFVNGAGVSNFSSTSYPSQNYQGGINATNNQFVGRYYDSANPSYYNDCYFSEINFIDGQALDASYFGYFDPVTNIWQPKKYTGTYGTNGFYFPFNQYGSTLMLGKNAGNPSNLFTYSEQFDNAAWSKPAAPVAPTVTANSTTAPDGTTTADTLNWSGATAHPVYQETTVPTFTLGDTYTFSVYLKKSTAGQFNIQVVWFYTAGGNQDGYVYATFDSNGILTSFTPSNSYIQATAKFIGNGWYRVSCTSTHQGGGAGTVIRGSVGQGSGASSVYAWGAQFNLGNTPDTYLQTTSSALNQTWTPNNFSVTAGTTYDSMVDSPTNVFTTATDTGGVVPGNYCTLNPLFRGFNLSWSNANLSVANTTTESVHRITAGTMAMTTGKWYWEVYANNSANVDIVGLISDDFVPDNYVGGSGASAGWGYNISTGTYYAGTGWTSSGTATAHPSSGIIMVAFDADAKKLWFGKQGVWNTAAGGVGDPSSGTNPTFTYSGTKTVFFPAVSIYSNTGTWTFNFGQRPWSYTPPSGFKSLNTTNLQSLGSATIGKAGLQPYNWMDVSLYGGTGSYINVTNSGFNPDLIFGHRINTTGDHFAVDSVRGGSSTLAPNTSAVEAQQSFTFNFTNRGFNVNSSDALVNGLGNKYYAWQWKQSPNSGFNIIPYTGTGVARSISHNLGVAPTFMIIKQRDVVNRSWCVYHGSLSNPQAAFYLDSVADPFAYTAFFNNTAPTSSNFSLGTDASVNQSGSNYIAYVWAEVPGFSKFGSYTANNSADGPFAYLGFRPKWVLIRHSNLSTGVSRDWLVYDSTRNPYNGYNPLDGGAQAFITGVPYNGSSSYGDAIDFVSNGFKFRNAASPNYNASSETYVYAAFAESPFALNNRAR